MPSILSDLGLSVEEDFRLLLQLALLTLLLMIFLYPLDAGRFCSGSSFESPSLSALLAAFRLQAPASHAIGLSRLRCAVVKVRDELGSSGNLEDDTVLRSAFSHPDPPRSPAPVSPCGSGISAGFDTFVSRMSALRLHALLHLLLRPVSCLTLRIFKMFDLRSSAVVSNSALSLERR